MTLLLKDALRPNLVQTLEGGPALVHAGPFGNIAHGCNSLVATRTALALGDVVVTEAGFGSDLGAEKFFDIKCRAGGLDPQAAVLVATVRSLKMQGGADKKQLTVEDLGALERGLPHVAHHLRNVQQFGVPVMVAVNRVWHDTDAELAMVAAARRVAGRDGGAGRRVGQGRRRAPRRWPMPCCRSWRRAGHASRRCTTPRCPSPTSCTPSPPRCTAPMAWTSARRRSAASST
jgi:formyltetrahydrofolate synthetase